MQDAIQKIGESMPRIGEDVIVWYRLPNGKLTWVAGTVDGSDDGLFVDYELDGIDLRDCELWMLVPTPPKAE